MFRLSRLRGIRAIVRMMERDFQFRGVAVPPDHDFNSEAGDDIVLRLARLRARHVFLRQLVLMGARCADMRDPLQVVNTTEVMDYRLQQARRFLASLREKVLLERQRSGSPLASVQTLGPRRIT